MPNFLKPRYYKYGRLVFISFLLSEFGDNKGKVEVNCLGMSLKQPFSGSEIVLAKICIYQAGNWSLRLAKTDILRCIH